MGLTTRSSFDEYAAYLRERRPFKTGGALFAERRGAGGPAGYVGRLPERWRQSLEQAVYVVYSYGTPIAWVDTSGRWTQPDVHYSVTTTRHQSKIATAISTL